MIYLRLSCLNGNDFIRLASIVNTAVFYFTILKVHGGK